MELKFAQRDVINTNVLSENRNSCKLVVSVFCVSVCVGPVSMIMPVWVLCL